jgi:hypothetical protein
MWRSATIHIHSVLFPSGRIIADVFTDAVQFYFIPNDVFPIIALPQSTRKCWPTQLFHAIRIPFGGHRFEPVYNVAQRQRCHMRRRGRPLCLPVFNPMWLPDNDGTNDHNSVDMVRHDDKFINIHSGVIRRDFTPNGLNHATGVVQRHRRGNHGGLPLR